MDYYDLFLEIGLSSEETLVDFFYLEIRHRLIVPNLLTFCQIWIKHCIVSSLAFSLHALS